MRRSRSPGRRRKGVNKKQEDSHGASAADSIPSGVNDIKVELFRFPAHLTQTFEIESSARQHVIRLHDAGDVSYSQQFCSRPPTIASSAATDIDVLRSLPDDLISEILKRLRNADIRTFRRVSRSWRHAFPTLVHQFPGCSQLPARKALWIATLASDHHENAVAFLSNKTCNRSKLYSRIFQFAGKETFPADLTMVASEAGLICMLGDIRTSKPNDSKMYLPHHASPSAGDSSLGSSFRLIVCNPVLMDFKALPTFQDPSEDLFAEPEALIMRFGSQILEEKPEAKHFVKVGLVVDAHDLSYKVVVVRANMKVQVFDSSCGDWQLGAAPPEGICFPEDKLAVTYKACIYFVAQAGNVTPRAPSGQVKWFIMRYDTKQNTWQELRPIHGVHHVDSWTICEHTSPPDLVAMSDGVILVADNSDFTNKHIFRYNHTNCEWDLIFHVPIFHSYISRTFRHLKCIGTQMNLYFLLPNSFPFVEVDIGSQQWAWCLPGQLHSEQSMKTFLDTFSVTGTVAFEPSLHPAS